MAEAGQVRVNEDESDEKDEAQHVDRIHDFKHSRAARQLEHALREILATAKEPGANLMPSMIAALEVGATHGEIAGVLRVAHGVPYDPFGRVQPVISLAQ